MDEIQVLLGLRKSHIIDDDEHDGDVRNTMTKCMTCLFLFSSNNLACSFISVYELKIVFTSDFRFMCVIFNNSNIIICVEFHINLLNLVA